MSGLIRLAASSEFEALDLCCDRPCFGLNVTANLHSPRSLTCPWTSSTITTCCWTGRCMQARPRGLCLTESPASLLDSSTMHVQ